MKKRIILVTLIWIITIAPAIAKERFKPIIGRSGSIMDKGNIRFLFGWGYQDKEGTGTSTFDFGFDIGLPASEGQVKINYLKVEKGDYSWRNLLTLVKFRLAEGYNAPSWAAGAGIKIPLHKDESLGLHGGFYMSSRIKKIDFDFNFSFNPYITYADYGICKIRPPHYINVILYFKTLITDFLKAGIGMDFSEKFGGKEKIGDTTSDYGNGSVWNLNFACRIKPRGYPVIWDNSIAIGLSSGSPYDWQFKTGVQFQPISESPEW